MSCSGFDSCSGLMSGDDSPYCSLCLSSPSPRLRLAPAPSPCSSSGCGSAFCTYFFHDAHSFSHCFLFSHACVSVCSPLSIHPCDRGRPVLRFCSYFFHGSRYVHNPFPFVPRCEFCCVSYYAWKTGGFRCCPGGGAGEATEKERDALYDFSSSFLPPLQFCPFQLLTLLPLLCQILLLFCRVLSSFVVVMMMITAVEMMKRRSLVLVLSLWQQHETPSH